MQAARLTTIGVRRPTGGAMSPGRWAGLGRTRPEAHEASVQHLLPLHEQPDGSGRPEPGSFSSGLQDALELSSRIRRFSHVADERDAESSGGSLPEIAAGSDDGFDRGHDAGSRREAIVGADAGQDRACLGAEPASAARTREALAGTSRSGDLARPAGFGIQRDSNSAASARGNGEIENQPRALGAGAYTGRNGISELKPVGEGLR